MIAPTRRSHLGELSAQLTVGWLSLRRGAVPYERRPRVTHYHIQKQYKRDELKCLKTVG